MISGIIVAWTMVYDTVLAWFECSLWYVAFRCSQSTNGIHYQWQNSLPYLQILPSRCTGRLSERAVYCQPLALAVLSVCLARALLAYSNEDEQLLCKTAILHTGVLLHKDSFCVLVYLRES